MPRNARKNFNSGFFHIMIQGINKEYVFDDEIDRKQFLKFMKKYYSKYNIKLISYCIMDNHAHFIIHSEDTRQISLYMHKINTLYAIYYNKKKKRVGYVFRDRYKSQYIYDRQYLLKCIKYIHMNPVKANMVESEEKYKYSSYNDYMHKKGFIDDNIIKLVFLNDNYLKLFKNINDVDVEIMDIERDNDNFENAIRKYLVHNNLNLSQISNNKAEMYKFSLMLISKGFSQKQISQKLNVSPTKISRILKRN